MVKVLVVLGKPVDFGEFDKYFEETHRPLLAGIPKLEAVAVNRVAGAMTGESPFHLVVELQFASEEAMQEGLNSESGQAMAHDFGGFASGGVSVLLCQSAIEPIGSAGKGDP